MRYRELYFLAVVIVLLSGCSAHLRNTSPTNKSLAFAYIDFSEIEMYTESAKIKQMSPASKRPSRDLGKLVNPGGRGKYTVLLWNEDLPNGSHQITLIGGKQTLILRHGKVWLDLGDSGQNVTTVQIDEPGIYFMGAYKYHPSVSTWATQFGAPIQFELMPIADPKPEELLAELLKISNGTAWEAHVSSEIKRIKELGGNQGN